MEKKRYMPMEMKVEEFQMNEAVAGSCTFTLQSESAVCDNCFPSGKHTWTVYSNGSYGIGKSNQTCVDIGNGWENPSAIEVIGNCGKYPVQAGQFFEASDDGRTEGSTWHWDPNGDNNQDPPYYGFVEVSGPVTPRDSVIYNQNS